MASNRSVRRAQEPVTYTCALCDSEDKVRWYCNDCHKNLCDRCKETHTGETKTKNDEVVPIGKANRQGDKPVPEVCKLHPGKLCDLYCSDCDMLLCNICSSETHKHHSCKPFENEYSTKKQHLKEHLTELSDKIEYFRNVTTERHHVNEAFTDNIDTLRDEVNSQRNKIKAEVDSIADAILAELSSLEKEQSAMHKKDCQRSEKKVEELTRMLEKAERTDISTVSLFETERSLKTTLPLYDVTVKNALPKFPKFITGSIDRVNMARMLGKLLHENQYQEKDIDSKHVQRLSKFTVIQQNQIQNQIFSICPDNDCHAWLSIRQYKGLVRVNMKGVVTETVKLDFCPSRITMVGTTDILITSDALITSVYKLSLHNKQVTTFADIRPHKGIDISINKRDEVFVSTGTRDLVVLNQSGTIVRKVTVGLENVGFVACLSSGCLCVGKLFRSKLEMALDGRKILTIDESGTVKRTWTGSLDNDKRVDSMQQCRISCDKYDRLFVPDFRNNQVYVLPRDGTQAKCLLDQKHGMMKPVEVSVDKCGNVWIGCVDGTIHVMGL